jgi:undecaprenyl-diphosphatase
LLIIAGGIWVFVEVADEVIEGGSQRYDEAILRALRQPGDPSQPIGPIWLKTAALDFTSLGSTAVITLVCTITVGFFVLRRKWGSVILVLVAIAGGAIVNSILKQSFERARPSLVPHLAEVNSLSFPSGHSMLSAITYITLGTLLARTTSDRKIKIYYLATAIFLAGLIGLTRVYLGVHYPTDVLAGWCAGISWALLCSLAARWLQRRGAVEAEAPAESTP